MNRKLLAAFGILVSMAWGSVQADMITLDSWNVDELNNIGDHVTVGLAEGGSILTVQWVDGDLTGGIAPGALDKFYMNTTVALVGVYVGDTSGANLLRTDWSLETTCKGCKNKADFGTFLNFTTSPGKKHGIDWAITNSLIFVLSEGVTWTPNAAGNTFAAHIRYDNDCSGWVGDGGTQSGASSSSNCGSVDVPEPATLALFGLGLIGFGLARRRKS